jgi:hypothetical protein
MQISYPASNSNCPPNYTIWGTYDAFNPATNPAATMTNVSDNSVVNAANFQFRSDGYWTAQFANLTVGATYNVNASYVRNGTTIYAPTVENVTVEENAPVVAPPPETPPPPPPDDLSVRSSSVSAHAQTQKTQTKDATTMPHAQVILMHGSYPANLPVVRLSAIVYDTESRIAVSNVTGIVMQGRWAVLIPQPLYTQTQQYLCELLFLDPEGQVLTQTRLHLG